MLITKRPEPPKKDAADTADIARRLAAHVEALAPESAWLQPHHDRDLHTVT